MGYARVIQKKKRKNIEKIDKCPRYLKQWDSDARLKKRKRKKR
jgi:hypothetical protein